MSEALPPSHRHEPEAEIFRALAQRLRIPLLVRRFPERVVWATFIFVSGALTIGLLSGVAMVSHTPFVFPSLGPTAFLIFFAPSKPASTPRHSLLGHAIGLVCGYGALWLTGLRYAAPSTVAGVSPDRIAAAALSLGATGALMVLFKVAHPPAGATTLIVSLGFVTAPFHLVVIEIAVGLLVLQAMGINRIAGLDYPLWERHPRKPSYFDPHRLR